MHFHHERSPGEFIERIEGDVTEFATFFSQLVLRVAGNLLLLRCSNRPVLINWRLGVGFTLFAAVTLIGLNFVRNVAVPYQKAHRDAETDLFGFLEERLAGTEDIRSCGAVDYVMRRLYQLQKVILKCWRKASLMHLCIGTTAGLLLMCGFGLAFVLGYHLFRAVSSPSAWHTWSFTTPVLSPAPSAS